MVSSRNKVSTTSVLLPYLSEFRLFSHKVGLGFIRPTTRSKNRVLYFSESTLDGRCLYRTVKPLQHLAEFQAPHFILDSLISFYQTDYSGNPIQS